MAAIAGLDALITLATASTAEQLWWQKQDRINGTVGANTIISQPISLWTYDGAPCTTGSAPGATALVPTSATAGALPFTNAGGGAQKRLLGGFVVSQSTGTLVLYDRLLHISSLDPQSTGVQTVGGSLTRNTAGIGNQIWIEIYSQIGASTTSITASYTNQAAASKTTPAVRFGNTNFREVTRIIPMCLAAGDTGVQGVTSVTAAATTGSTGDFGVTIAKPIAYFGMQASGVPTYLDFSVTSPKLHGITTDACLALAWFPTAAAAPPQFFGLFNTGEA